MLVVTDPSGNVGAEVVEQLAARTMGPWGSAKPIGAPPWILRHPASARGEPRWRVRITGGSQQVAVVPVTFALVVHIETERGHARVAPLGSRQAFGPGEHPTLPSPITSIDKGLARHDR
ncbi:hypothetical protein [Saccharopolyspora sp. SCSIO 74807]|uniref:hypothetical protein n=1 Tax=Saccharopolyspora sp. SCSIO 74807 TaxID=3118084 RepID=UPI0030CF8C76